MKSRRFPLLGTKASIPWALAERAFEEFRLAHGFVWTLEMVAGAGGFMPEELDAVLPCWRREWEALEPRAA